MMINENSQEGQIPVEMKAVNNNNDCSGVNSGGNAKGNKNEGKTIEEQCQYYKNMFQKSKKLNVYYDEENKKLQAKLNQYEGENGKVCELVFIFKYETQSFYFFKNEEKHYFINEKLLAEAVLKEIKSNPSIKTYDFLSDIKSKDEYLTQIITQYDDKLRRIAGENESNESKISLYKAQCENMTKMFNEAQSYYESTIKDSIANSNEILVQLKNICDVDLSDDLLRKEVYTKLQSSINQLVIDSSTSSSSSVAANKNKWSQELKAYNSKLLMNYLDSVFKSVNSDIETSAEKKKWQGTIDQLLLSHDEEKSLLYKTIEQHKTSMKGLGQKITIAEQEKYNIAKQKDQTIALLNKQLNNGVNMNYLKNILMSFLTTKDNSIQDGLLPVIFTSLQFNESEIKQVKDEREKNAASLFSYFS